MYGALVFCCPGGLSSWGHLRGEPVGGQKRVGPPWRPVEGALHGPFSPNRLALRGRPSSVGLRYFVVPQTICSSVILGSFRSSDAPWPWSFLSLRNSCLKAKVAGLRDVDDTSPTGHCAECFMHINTGHKLLACVCAHTRVCRMTSLQVWSLGL